MTIKYSAGYQPIVSEWKPPEWLLSTFNGMDKKINKVAKQQIINIASRPALEDCKVIDQMNQVDIPKLLEKLRQNPLFENVFQYASTNGPPIHISIAADYPKELPPAFIADAKNSEGQPIRRIVIRHHPESFVIMGILIFEICNAFHQPQSKAIFERLRSSEFFDREELT